MKHARLFLPVLVLSLACGCGSSEPEPEDVDAPVAEADGDDADQNDVVPLHVFHPAKVLRTQLIIMFS